MSRVLVLAVAVGLALALPRAFSAAQAFQHAAAGAGLLLLDEPEPAADRFDRALALNDWPSSYTHFGVKAFQRAGRSDEALAAINVLVARYPDEPRYYERRALLYNQMILDERVGAFLDERPPDNQRITLLAQLRDDDVRMAGKLGAHFEEEEPLPPERLEPGLYGRWKVVEVNGQYEPDGRVWEFQPRTLSYDVAGFPMPYEIQKNHSPRRIVVKSAPGMLPMKYSYRLEGDELWLATSVGFMDPPSTFRPGVMLDGSPAPYFGTAYRLVRLEGR